jgi:hypothetical protein
MLDHLPTPVVCADTSVGTRLAEQLHRAGFLADAAPSCWAAHAAMSARFYASLVCFVDPAIASSIDDLLARLTAFARRSRPQNGY